jgi:pSer/pThr/pTyr-binding forkhead associated (FHA) protein
MFCPECGEATDRDGQKFCMECGAGLADVQGETGPLDDLDGADTIVQDRESLEEEFAQAVGHAMADGAIDDAEQRRLDELRLELRISPERAREIVEMTVDDMTGPDAGDAHVSGPVLLEFNRNRFYMDGMAGILDFRLTNMSDDAVWVEFSARSQLAGEHCKRVHLEPCRPMTLPFQVKLSDSGVVLLEVEMRVDGARRTVWQGHCRIRVLKYTENVRELAITVNQNVQAEQGGKAGYGVSMRNEFDRMVDSGALQTPNDLLQREFPDQWEPVRMSLDDYATRRWQSRGPDRARLCPAFVGMSPAPGRLALHVQRATGPERLLLFGSGDVSFGRRRESDITLRYWPRSLENDRMSLRVQGSEPGQHHSRLQVRESGIYITDHNTLNGTTLDGRPVQGEARLPLDHSSEIDIARALRLRMAPFRLQDNEGNRADHYQGIAPADRLWQTARRHGVRSLVIERLNNMPDAEKYVIVCSWIEIGRGPDNEVLLVEDSLAQSHARIVRLGPGFYLESLVSGRGPCVDGTTLDQGELAPLRPGMTLAFGDRKIAVGPYEQYGLESR